MNKIFISYRREDSGTVTGRMYDWLTQRIPKSDVFFDVDLEYGVDFVQRIHEAIAQCKAVVVVIGPHWTTANGAPSPYVQMEVEHALSTNVRVIPVLVGGATMPPADQLPPSLRRLTTLNAASVRDGRDFFRDMQDLATTLGVATGEKELAPQRRGRSPRVVIPLVSGVIVIALAALLVSALGIGPLAGLFAHGGASSNGTNSHQGSSSGANPNGSLQVPGLTTTTLIPSYSGAIGASYAPGQDRLVFVGYGSGAIGAINYVTTHPELETLGTGYTEPESIFVMSDGQTAYVTERTGDLVRVDLNNADRSAAIVVASDLQSPQQVTADGAGNLYVVEFTSPARLVRIDHATGTETAVVSDLSNPVGVAVTSDAKFAYVSHRLPDGTGEIIQINLATSAEASLVTIPNAPLFQLTWADAAQNGIFVVARAPVNKIWLVDMTTHPAQPRLVASTVEQPACVAVISQSGAAFPIVVFGNAEVDELKP